LIGHTIAVAIGLLGDGFEIGGDQCGDVSLIGQSANGMCELRVHDLSINASQGELLIETLHFSKAQAAVAISRERLREIVERVSSEITGGNGPEQLGIGALNKVLHSTDGSQRIGISGQVSETVLKGQLTGSHELHDVVADEVMQLQLISDCAEHELELKSATSPSGSDARTWLMEENTVQDACASSVPS
jgi:hypothetical protein